MVVVVVGGGGEGSGVQGRGGGGKGYHFQKRYVFHSRLNSKYPFFPPPDAV